MMPRAHSPGHEIEVRRLAANHDAERDERVVAIGFDQLAARERQFETARNFDSVDVVGARRRNRRARASRRRSANR